MKPKGYAQRYTMLSKKEARRLAAVRERECTETYLRSADEASFQRLFELEAYRRAETIFSYIGIGLEPDTAVIINNALKSGKKVAVPKITGRGTMEAAFISSLEELSEGAFGLLEPPAGYTAVELSETDVIILPASAFSRRLERLGRGGGYYDRFLLVSRGIKIGIGREQLLFDTLPTEPHDIGPDVLITEKEIRSRR